MRYFLYTDKLHKKRQKIQINVKKSYQQLNVNNMQEKYSSFKVIHRVIHIIHRCVDKITVKKCKPKKET